MGKVNESQVDYWLGDDGLMLISCWARDGYTLQEISDKIGIARMTLHKWKKQYPEIRKAIEESKEVIDYKVENALLKAALGYKTKEIKVTLGKKIINGEVFNVLKETTEKEVGPNVTACMAWLNNRKHDQWKRNRDKVLELDEEENNVSITIVRGPRNDNLGENVNQEVNFRPKTKEEMKNGKEKAKEEAEDRDYWPEDWEEDED